MIWLYWVVPDEVDGAARERAAAVLDAGERDRLRRLQDPRRSELLVGRALLRHALARHLGAAPGDFAFTEGAHGRPELDSPWRFNLSHTAGLIVCVLSHGVDVGVDVERRERRGDLPAIAGRYFAPVELAGLRALPAAEQRARFVRIWTLKEAYIKARGLGLSLRLDHFWFEVDAGPPRLVCDPRLDERAEDWQVIELGDWPEHQVAVAARRGPGPDLPIAVNRLEW